MRTFAAAVALLTLIVIEPTTIAQQHQSVRNLVLAATTPVDYVLVRLGSHTGKITIDDHQPFGDYFDLKADDDRAIVVRKSLTELIEKSPIVLRLLLETPLSDGSQLERIESLTVTIVPETSLVQFADRSYHGHLEVGAPVGTPIRGLEKLGLVEGRNIRNLRYSLRQNLNQQDAALNNSDFLRLTQSGNYALITTSRVLTPSYRGSRTVILEATGEPIGNRDEIVLTIGIDDDQDRYPPVFAEQRYFVMVDQAPVLGASILRVQAFADHPASTVVYSLASSSNDTLLPFDIDPFSGDIFAADQLNQHRYVFDVLADDRKLYGRASVTVLIGRSANGCRDGASCLETTVRYKRAFRPEIIMELPENHPVNTSLPKKIPLRQRERIKDAPIETDHLIIYADGSLALTRPLNFEVQPRVLATVIVENTVSLDDSPQPVVISVQDVDESPKIVTEPMPYLAVVPVDTTPELTVFRFQAFDELGDSKVDDDGIAYEQSGGTENFKIDESGQVKTCKSKYKPGETYQVFVRAVDKYATNEKTKYSDMAVLNILAGQRAPQFYQERYKFSVPENTRVRASVAVVKAKSFSNDPIRYQLVNKTGQAVGYESEAFSIDPVGGVIHLMTELDYDDVQNYKRFFSLKAVASSGGLKSEVPVDIQVTDVNDNSPIFSQPLYTAKILENHQIGKKILQVSAKDFDGGRNAKIRYSLNNGNFSIDNNGVISARLRLDADQQFQGYFLYNFSVFAHDHGIPPRSSSSQVQIKTINVNDEAPVFIPISQYTELINEDAQGDTPIMTVQAQDPDRDQVKYYFLQNGSQTDTVNFFYIDSDTGSIKLVENVTPEQLKKHDTHMLTVIAVDDGSCCKELSKERHTSTATVHIGVKDVNNNIPVFNDCEEYSKRATLTEGQHLDDKVIITVKATDNDSGKNGDIMYSIYYPEGETRKPFNIDLETGAVTPSRYMTFDRETRPFEDVTVKATDRGDRPLIGFCHFTVTIIDVNDNAPQFDRNGYQATVSRSMRVGHSVITVYANDQDAPHNAEVTYSLKSETSEKGFDMDYSFFNITKYAGEVILTKRLPLNKTKMMFRVVATDSGVPPKSSVVPVTLNVAESAQHYPVWKTSDHCPNSITVREDVQIYKEFVRCYAVSGTDPNNPIIYSILIGAKAGTNSNGDFRSFQKKENGSDWVVIKNMRSLDYEKTKKYDITISAKDAINSLSIDKTIVVNLIDTNDNVPKFSLDKFTGQVEEEKDVNSLRKTPIVRVEARDNDEQPAFREITYSLVPSHVSKFFYIDRITGDIYANASFDREKTDSFMLDVQAEDGAPSDLPGTKGPNTDITKVQIIVGDINDNVPYFNQSLYEGKVRENVDISQVVMSVKAHDVDKDSELRYSLASEGNDDRAFAVHATSGAILVNGPLDYETKKSYDLTLRVTDGNRSHVAETKIHIDILDVNDNAPQFTEQSGQYTAELREEDPTVPKKILHVRATDRDEDKANQTITYRLIGQGANKEFTINERTGEIFVNKPLDRDPPMGAEEWNFVVHAVDAGGLFGYADVKVTLTDINDNAPFFEGKKHYGQIEEGRSVKDQPGGIYVMTMTATDHDDPKTPNAKLKYEIIGNKYFDNSTNAAFRIDSATGKIFAMREFDREDANSKEFQIRIKASDHGTIPRMGTEYATIRVLDINDNPPYFDKIDHEPSVIETAPIGFPVMSLSAKDPDDEAFDNVLQYSLLEMPDDFGTRYFYVTTDPDNSGSNVGTVRVKEKLDYEDVFQKNGFRLTVGVTDGIHSTSTPVRIRLNDANDNAPIIRPVPTINVREDARPGHVVANFTALDADKDGKDPFEFRISRASDPNRQFSIGPQDGVLRVAKPLNREEQDQYRLLIEAVDSKNQVGNTTLVVNLEDVNDNAPEFDKNNLIVWENQTAPVKLGPVVVFDRDTINNGPKFTLIASEVVNTKFGIDFYGGDPTKQIYNGTLTLTTKVNFDREVDGKFIDVPFQLFDSGNPVQNQTRYLRILIGDANDNPMRDGDSVIRVFNYENKLPTTVIGRAYVDDLDDWDLEDKRFTLTGSNDRFTVSLLDGNITMAEETPPGEYNIVVAVEDIERHEKATARVKVLVETVTYLQVKNAGSLRLKNVPADDFIRQDGKGGFSLYDKLRNWLAKKTGVSSDSVSIFSVKTEEHYPPLLQVFFSVRGQPYLQPAFLHGIISQDIPSLENELGRSIQVTQVNVDDCIFESCDTGCRRLAEPVLVTDSINANATSLLGVGMNVTAQCNTCDRENAPTTCSPNPCKNGGLCHPAKPSVFCECRGDYHGTYCEGRTRSFTGSSVAWLEPINSCQNLHVRFDFSTRSNDALLLYNGPMYLRDKSRYWQTDFIAFQIQNGRLVLVLNLGDGEKRVELNIENVNDGNWHNVDFVAFKQDFILTYDSCKRNESGNCQVTGVVPSDYTLLNVITPLQLGGLAVSQSTAYPQSVVTTGYDGCLRNLYINEQLQDLGTPAYAVNSVAGCPSDLSCLLNGSPFCLNGYCLQELNGARCVCDPGYIGEQCDKKITWRGFDGNSEIVYTVNPSGYSDPRSLKLRMLVRPFSKTGSLISLSNTNSDADKVHVRNGNLSYMLPPIDVLFQRLKLVDGLWLHHMIEENVTYLVESQREPTFAKLSLDGLSSPDMSASHAIRNSYLMPQVAQIRVGNSAMRQQPFGLNGCVGQVWLNDESLPLAPGDPESIASIETDTAQPTCPNMLTCQNAGLNCQTNYVCKDLWKGPFCTCVDGVKPLFDAENNWVGCGVMTAALRLGITNGALAAILVCLVVLICLVLIMVVFTRQRRIIRERSPYPDVRENIINYAEEGGGEADQDRYNIAPLRKPVLPPEEFRQREPHIPNGRPTTPPDGNMQDLIRDRVRLADTDPTAPPYDELRIYADEDALSIGSLSSLSSDESDIDLDELNTWGPRFRKLADLYGGRD